MQTLTAAAILATLSAPAFAADAHKVQPSKGEKAVAPIVLTATQLDHITAGAGELVELDYTVDASQIPGLKNRVRQYTK